jgi:hypothetical protein
MIRDSHFLYLAGFIIVITTSLYFTGADIDIIHRSQAMSWVSFQVLTLLYPNGDFNFRWHKIHTQTGEGCIRRELASKMRVG